MALECRDGELEDFTEDVVYALAKIGYSPFDVGYEITATHESILVAGINMNKDPSSVAAEMHTAELEAGWYDGSEPRNP